MNLHSPPASYCTCFLSVLGTSLQTGGGGKDEGARLCVCLCEQVKLFLQRELEGVVVRRVEGDDERQTVVEWETDREESRRANSLKACVMLSCVRAVLIQVNPAGTYTYGRRAQPSSHSVIPYGWQIKG